MKRCKICNKEIVKGKTCRKCIQKKYRQNHLQQNKERIKKFYEMNKEKILQWHKDYYLKKKQLRPDYKEIKLCEFCGEEIKIGIRRKYCSKLCSDRNYRKENRQKLREVNKKFREIHKEKIKEYRKQWEDKNKNIYYKKYREQNAVKLSKLRKEYYLANQEKIKARTKAYYEMVKNFPDFQDKKLKYILNSDYYYKRICANRLGISIKEVDPNLLETYKIFIQLKREKAKWQNK